MSTAAGTAPNFCRASEDGWSDSVCLYQILQNIPSCFHLLRRPMKMNLAFSIVESSSQVMEKTEGLKLILEPLHGHCVGKKMNAGVGGKLKEIFLGDFFQH